MTEIPRLTNLADYLESNKIVDYDQIVAALEAISIKFPDDEVFKVVSANKLRGMY